MATPATVAQLIRDAFECESVEVEDLTGTQNHYGVTVVSAAFQGKSAVERHQMVYRALGKLMKEEVHALTINPKLP